LNALQLVIIIISLQISENSVKFSPNN